MTQKVQLNKKLTVFLFLIVMLLCFPASVKAEDDVWYAVAANDEAVFYLADADMSTVYKYTISGFRGSSPSVEHGSWVVNPQNLRWSVDWMTPQNPQSFRAPVITDMTLYASSIQAHRTDWYSIDGTHIDTELHPEFVEAGNDDGRIYYGLSVKFENFQLKNGYHVEEENVTVQAYGTNSPAYAYNHLYTRDNVYAPYVSGKENCLKLDCQTNFKKLLLCNAHIWTYGGRESEFWGLSRLSGTSSFDANAGTMTLNGPLFYFGGIKWVDSRNGKTAMQSDIPVYIFDPVLNTHTISYDANGGTGNIDSHPAAYGQNFILKDGFSWEGHDFKGYAVIRKSDNSVYCGTLGWQPMSVYGTQPDKWTLFQPGSEHTMAGEWINSAYVNGDEFTFYAQWEEDVYHTILYSANGGSGNISSDTVVDNGQFTLKDGFYADGYRFTGYALVRQSDDKVYCKDGLGWQPMSEYLSKPDKWAIFQPGTTHTLDGPWKNPSYTGGDTFVFCAQWERISEDSIYHTILYSANGGSGSIDPDTVADNGQFTLKDGFYADGYRFTGYALVRQSDDKVYCKDGLGWQPMSEYQSKPDKWAIFQPGTTHTLDGPWKNPSHTGSDTFVFCAQWEMLSYRVVLRKGTGIAQVSGGGTYDYGDEVNISATLKPGYHWVKWTGTYEKRDKETSFTMPQQDVEMTANGAANEYTVIYDANTGSGNMPTDTCTFDREYTLLENRFTKSGYHFLGWNTNADGSGAPYAGGVYGDKAAITDNFGGLLEERENGTSVTLYAQ